MGHFLPCATISINRYKLATSFFKGIVSFCPSLKMEGAFSYCNDLVTIISEKREEKSQTGCQAAMNKTRGGCCSQPQPGHCLLPRHLCSSASWSRPPLSLGHISSTWKLTDHTKSDQSHGKDILRKETHKLAFDTIWQILLNKPDLSPGWNTIRMGQRLFT